MPCARNTLTGIAQSLHSPHPRLFRGCSCLHPFVMWRHVAGWLVSDDSRQQPDLSTHQKSAMTQRPTLQARWPRVHTWSMVFITLYMTPSFVKFVNTTPVLYIMCSIHGTEVVLTTRRNFFFYVELTGTVIDYVIDFKTCCTRKYR
jgi:hypothetical protein